MAASSEVTNNDAGNLTSGRQQLCMSCGCFLPHSLAMKTETHSQTGLFIVCLFLSCSKFAILLQSNLILSLKELLMLLLAL